MQLFLTRGGSLQWEGGEGLERAGSGGEDNRINSAREWEGGWVQSNNETIATMSCISTMLLTLLSESPHMIRGVYKSVPT